MSLHFQHDDITIECKENYQYDTLTLHTYVASHDWHHWLTLSNELIYEDVGLALDTWYKSLLDHFLVEIKDPVTLSRLADAGYKFIHQQLGAKNPVAVPAKIKSNKPTGYWAAEGFVKKYKDEFSLADEGIKLLENPAKIASDRKMLAEESHRLPGIDTSVELPCGCKRKKTVTTAIVENPSSINDFTWHTERTGEPVRMLLREGIIHLNDGHRWTREQIADWLDELHDSGEVNIEFPVPEELEKS